MTETKSGNTRRIFVAVATWRRHWPIVYRPFANELRRLSPVSVRHRRAGQPLAESHAGATALRWASRCLVLLQTTKDG